MHKLHCCPVDSISKEGDLWLQDASAALAGWHSEVQHLFILQKDVTIWCYRPGLSAPAGIHFGKAPLEVLSGRKDPTS